MKRPAAAAFAAATALMILLTFAAGGQEKDPAPSPPAGKATGADLYALTEAVARRARDLDLADLRIQEERRLLEKLREDVGRQIALLDRKLTEFEKHSDEREKERKEARVYIARVFRAMAAEDAAARLKILGQKDSARILRELKEKDAAKILARMDPEFSAAVTQYMEKMP